MCVPVLLYTCGVGAMRAKLTLMIEKDVVEKAKEYARGRNKSVSRIVEEYLKKCSRTAERITRPCLLDVFLPIEFLRQFH